MHSSATAHKHRPASTNTQTPPHGQFHKRLRQLSSRRQALLPGDAKVTWGGDCRALWVGALETEPLCTTARARLSSGVAPLLSSPLIRSLPPPSNSPTPPVSNPPAHLPKLCTSDTLQILLLSFPFSSFLLPPSHSRVPSLFRSHYVDFNTKKINQHFKPCFFQSL